MKRIAELELQVTRATARAERAEAIVAVYVHHLRQAIAAMTASMNGLSALVFTAGVGEHAPRARAAVCEGLAFLGVALDPARNASCVEDGSIFQRVHARGGARDTGTGELGHRAGVRPGRVTVPDSLERVS